MSGVLQYLRSQLPVSCFLKSFPAWRSGVILQRTASISKKQYTWPELDEKDIEEDFVRGSGPGGQAVAKTSNCVVLKHKPTGIVVRAHDTRSRSQNSIIARERLKYHLDIHLNKENSFDAIKRKERSESQKKQKEKARQLLERKRAFKQREGLD